LFYVNGNQELVVVEVDTEPSFAPGPESVLFSVAEYRSWNLNHSYSVAHDDLQFVYLKNVAVGIHETMRVLNFFEELKATVGNWAGPWGSGGRRLHAQQGRQLTSACASQACVRCE